MKINKLVSSSLIIAGISLSQSVLSDSWTFEIEPYAMGSTIDGDSTMGRGGNTDLAVNFDTILENLDLAGMILSLIHI